MVDFGSLLSQRRDDGLVSRQEVFLSPRYWHLVYILSLFSLISKSNYGYYTSAVGLLISRVILKTGFYLDYNARKITSHDFVECQGKRQIFFLFVYLFFSSKKSFKTHHLVKHIAFLMQFRLLVIHNSSTLNHFYELSIGEKLEATSTHYSTV